MEPLNVQFLKVVFRKEEIDMKTPENVSFIWINLLFVTSISANVVIIDKCDDIFIMKAPSVFTDVLFLIKAISHKIKSKKLPIE